MAKQRKATGKTCAKCAKTFTTKKDASNHVCATKNPRLYTCDACPTKTFKSSQTLSQHKKYMHSDKKPNFFCKFCGKSATNSSNLRTHERTHTGERPFQCHLCHKKFAQSCQLKLHIMYHEGTRNFECKYCKKRFFTASSIKVHERSHTGEKPHQCRYCKKSFADPNSWKKHERIHTGERYQCNHCPKSFIYYSGLACHTRRHQGITVECKICGKTLAYTSLSPHMKSVHKKVRHECQYCDKTFTSKEYIKVHIKNVHQKTQVECKYCSKLFLDQQRCDTHFKRIHSKDRKKELECDYCHETFLDKGYMYKHVIRHMNIYCKPCGRSFATTSDLRLHELNGCEKCSVCEKVFISKFRKDRHYMQYHGSMQMYTCDHCSKQFKSMELLKPHIKKQHMSLKFTCDRCGLTVNNRKHIINHIWNVHMVCLFCDICSKRFKHDSEFRHHKRAGCKRYKRSSKPKPHAAHVFQ